MSIFDSKPDGTVASGSTIRIQGRKLLEGMHSIQRNIYWLPLEILPGQYANLNVRKYKIWHRRLGHANKDVIRQLPNHTKGVGEIDPADEEPCEGCAFGKSTRRPFSSF